MRRRLAISLGAVLLLFGIGSTPASAAVALPGPRLATVEMIETKGSERPENESAPLMSLATVDPVSGGQQRFLRAPMEATGRVGVLPFYAPAWTADGSLIAFTAWPGKRGGKQGIYVVAPDGSGPRRIPGTTNGSNPVFSPDGRTLAFARSRFRIIDVGKRHPREPWRNRTRVYASTTTWVVDPLGGKPRRLTRWRDGLSNVPSSFAPDGSSLLLTKEDDNLPGPWIMSMPLSGGRPAEVLHLGKEPVFSPDGSRIAFTGYLNLDIVEAEEDESYAAPELYVANADGSNSKRLTRTDDVLESSPSWDPSGQRIAYVQVKGDTSWLPGLALLFPTGNALMQINADGSCRQQIASQRKVAFYGVAWQPGPGREAGPIAC